MRERYAVKREYKRERYSTATGRAAYLCRRARARARKRGLKFDLKPGPIAEAIERGACALTGLPFELGPWRRPGPHPFAPSLDRIDSSRGYTPDNVQVVCHAANQAKGAMTMEELRRLVTALVEEQAWARRN